jgi:hypothetical protein
MVDAILTLPLAHFLLTFRKTFGDASGIPAPTSPSDAPGNLLQA